MAEAVTPARQKAPIASRLQSPTSPFFLGSNDDQLERAQARAARSAAIRRKSVAPPPRPPSNASPDLFSKDQIVELFQNCIKLASENVIDFIPTSHLSSFEFSSSFFNFLSLFFGSVFGVQKINQKNTWDLRLIDHLSEIIRVEDDDAETNFQKVFVMWI